MLRAAEKWCWNAEIGGGSVDAVSSSEEEDESKEEKSSSVGGGEGRIVGCWVWWWGNTVVKWLGVVAVVVGFREGRGVLVVPLDMLGASVEPLVVPLDMLFVPFGMREVWSDMVKLGCVLTGMFPCVD